jgi:hypothetical protein
MSSLNDLFRYRRMTESALGGRTKEFMRDLKREKVIHLPECPGEKICDCSRVEERYWDGDDDETR